MKKILAMGGFAAAISLTTMAATSTPPADPYDLTGWTSFYEANPGYKRSCGADGDNDDGGDKGGDKIDVNSAEFKGALATAVEAASSGLKAKNDELLGKLKTATDGLSAFDGLDPVAMKTMMSSFDQSEEAKLIAEGKMDEVITKRTDRLKGDYEDKLKQLSTELEAAKGTSSKYQDRLQQNAIDNTVREAAIKSKVLPEALADVLRRAGDIFTLNDDGQLEARGKDGQLLKTSDEFLVTPERFIEGLRTTAPYYWPASESSGAHGNEGKGYTDGDSMQKLNDLATGNNGVIDQAAYRAHRTKMSGKDYQTL